MRAPYLFLLAGLVAGWPAWAQVSLNLDALNPPGAKPAPAPRQPAKPTVKPSTTSRPAQRAPLAAKPSPQPGQNPAPKQEAQQPPSPKNGRGAKTPTQAAATASTPMPALPEAPPARPVLAPAVTAAVPAPASPAAPPRTSATAGSSTAKVNDGMRIVFAAGKSELTPDSVASLSAFAKQVPAGETISFDLRAYAAGAPEDPSTPRRLALERAMAIRGALMADGISSSRIFVRAMGTPAASDGGPADRVDVAVLGLASTSAQLGGGAPVAR